jgi:hypothetical protein
MRTLISRSLTATALVLALTGLSGCTDMKDAWDDIAGESKPKAAVQTPAAAPVQDVKAKDLTQPVELGSISDTSLKPAEAAASEAKNAAADAQMAAADARTAAVAAATPAPVAANSVALLTIRFNQPHVYYEDALASAVKQAEAVRANMQYDVLSTIPDLSSLPADQQEKLAARAKDNLRNVVTKMQQLGVPADRIRIADQTLKIRSQEIQLFVR